MRISEVKYSVPDHLHIMGSVGSGKTTLAKKFAEIRAIAPIELDNVMWKRDGVEDIRRTTKERQDLLDELLKSDSWIVEGVHFDDWMRKSLEEADVILFLDTPLMVRYQRIIKRFLFQKLGRESANYRPSFRIFLKMFRWTHQFEKEKAQRLHEIQMNYDHLFIIKSGKEALKLFESSKDAD